ncbi:MAG: hypothetical protein G01um101433_660 [Parcubacteria group bacterium Gr01-1014_33]|nr:MAG: hypothetical protein G01um101433_660 [Parcubacteria group bacterium Gr01-1014_33]
MPLTKKDLSQIKEVVHEEIETSFENFAVLVNKGFPHVEEQMNKIDGRMDKMDGHLQHIDTRLDTIEHDIAEIRKHFVYRDEFEEVLERLSAIEKRLGIKARI